jgi:single-strand DNA-binding protein
MNQVILTGRLTKDPELRTTTSDKQVASFTLAVDKYGEGADFINCIVWGKQAENLCKYQEKGSQIGLSGRISVRSYEDDKGNKRNITEVVADSIEYLGSKKKDAPTEEVTPYDIKGEGNGIEIQDSDLPF